MIPRSSFAAVVLLVAVLAAALPGCALTGGGGWATGTPDAKPRALKVSIRAPISRDGLLLLGLETGAELHETPIRHGALLAGVRLRDPQLGSRWPALELAGALGLGRGNFDSKAHDFGTLTGMRLDLPIPVVATPAPASSRMRALFLGLELVPYAHGDLLWRAKPGRTWASGAEVGLGLRFSLGTDMTLMDAVRQVF